MCGMTVSADARFAQCLNANNKHKQQDLYNEWKSSNLMSAVLLDASRLMVPTAQIGSCCPWKLLSLLQASRLHILLIHTFLTSPA